MEIGFAEFKMDDGAALTFEFFGARKNSQRAFTV
jgi:hypothetical protein